MAIVTSNYAAKQLLANQLASPVRFVEQVEKLYAEGIDTFIEVGPGKILTGLVKSILADKPVTALAIDASAGTDKNASVTDLTYNRLESMSCTTSISCSCIIIN